MNIDTMIGSVAAPRTWPKLARRLYVLTFPVSILLQFAALLLLGVLGVLEAIGKQLVALWRLP